VLERPKLFPIDEIDGGHAFLALDPDGSVYAVGDAYWRIASTFDAAAEAAREAKRAELHALAVMAAQTRATTSVTPSVPVLADKANAARMLFISAATLDRMVRGCRLW
jgi:hypothetical protein